MSTTGPMAASNATSEPGPFLELLGRIAYEAQIMQPLLPTYIHLILSAIFPIYIASHASLNRPPSAAKLSTKQRRRTDDDDDEGARKVESLSPSDALVFPILAGGTLASLYFLLNWLQDPAWLNWALGIYFSHIGLWFAFIFLKDLFTVIKSFVFPKSYSAGGHVWIAELQERCYRSESGLKCGAPVPGYLRYLRFPGLAERSIWSLRSLMERKALLRFHVRTLVTAKFDVTPLHLAAFLTSASIVACNTFIDKPWYLTNFLGFSFCYGALQFTSPTTGWTGTLVLGALFFYDIYFVFFTPMMVTVATKLDVPIKLLFPRPDGCIVPVGAPEGSAEMEEYLRCIAKKRTMAMLGLGDIVVPGMMIAFALRFDLYLYYLMKQDQKSEEKPEYLPATGGWGERFWTTAKLQSDKLKAKSFKKTYFHATVFGYTAGMVTTVIVMQVAEHAQPALLYLVPGVVGMFWGTALCKGQLKTLWNYSEAEEEDKKDEKKEEKKDKKHETESSLEKEEDDVAENGHADKSEAKKTESKEEPKKDDEVDAWQRGWVHLSIVSPEAVKASSMKSQDRLLLSSDEQEPAETRHNLRNSSNPFSASDGSEEPALKRRRKV